MRDSALCTGFASGCKEWSRDGDLAPIWYACAAIILRAHAEPASLEPEPDDAAVTASRRTRFV
jgi:hypothetical protein